MIHVLLLLLFVLPGTVCAQGTVVGPGTGPDVELLMKVQADAFNFIAPRTLEQVTGPQLAMWGLAGLTAIDPALVAVLTDSKLSLSQRGRLVREFLVPGTDPGAWGQLAAQVALAGFGVSAPLRQAGEASLTKILLDGALAHIDPYSRYIPPIEANDDRDRRIGHAGVGLTLAQRGHQVVVREVVMGSPGALAGVMPGDVIQWIDGHASSRGDAAALSAVLNGPEGTDLRMGWIGRDGASRGATLQRIMIPPETVFPRRDGDVLFVQITGFSQTTGDHVATVLRDHLRGPHPVTGVALDLRGNRGGLLRVAVATANLFLPPGVVVRSAGRAAEANKVWLSGPGDVTKNARMAVLVDGGTASAAEVLAAALGDRGRAVVIGSASFGKGLVQTIETLPDGGELFLTWSRLLAPRGWPIQSLGVMPQICTSLGEESVTAQLTALSGGRSEMAAALGTHRAARAPVTPDDIVAIRARCPAADPREADVGLARTVLGDPAVYAAALLPEMVAEAAR